jgi:hypothetical protein
MVQLAPIVHKYALSHCISALIASVGVCYSAQYLTYVSNYKALLNQQSDFST